MKNSEIIEISNKMSPEIKFSIDSVRLLPPFSITLLLTEIRCEK